MSRHKTPVERLRLWYAWVNEETDKRFEILDKHPNDYGVQREAHHWGGYADGLKWALEELEEGDLDCPEDCTNTDHESRL